MVFAALPATLTPSGGLINVETRLCSEAIVAGLVVRKLANGNVEIANAVAAATADMVGIAVNETNAANQPITFARPGSVLTVSGLTAGESYYLGEGATEGQVGLFADAATANAFATLVGIALSATSLYIVGRETGVSV